MAYLWVKTLHMVAVISWMAGLLYLWRLYVYHAMETEAVVRSRFEVMERRLLRGIATPAAVLATGAGIAMLVMMPALLKQPSMHVKLVCVVLLLANHVAAHVYRQRLLATPTAFRHRTFRVLNEVPTVLMLIIVAMVIVRPLG
jgi:protoporphyrinogen IX oxidase